MQDLKYRMIRYCSAENLAKSTIQTYSETYEKIKNDVGELDSKSNEFWIDHLSRIPSPIYRNNIRSVILKVCRDVLGQNIKLPIVKRAIKLQPVYTIEEVAKIFSKIKNFKHIAISKLLFTESFRISEVLDIKLFDCIKKEGAIIIRNTKNGKDYKKFLDETTITAIRNYLAWCKDNNEMPKVRLFEGVGNHRYSATSVRMFLKKGMRLSGVEIKGSCHIFRRSASVWKCENGWSVPHLAASINNSPKTAQKYYALVRPEYLRTLQKPTV
jgi:integrase